MLRLIMKEKYKRGMITKEQYDLWIAKAKGNGESRTTTDEEVGEILDKAGLKRCAGALCSAPVPDNVEFCMKCKKKFQER